MDDLPGVEVTHGLRNLLGDVDALLHGEELRPDVDVSVQRPAFDKAVCVYVCTYVCVHVSMMYRLFIYTVVVGFFCGYTKNCYTSTQFFLQTAHGQKCVLIPILYTVEGDKRVDVTHCTAIRFLQDCNILHTNMYVCTA